MRSVSSQRVSATLLHVYAKTSLLQQIDTSTPILKALTPLAQLKTRLPRTRLQQTHLQMPLLNYYHNLLQIYPLHMLKQLQQL